MPTTPKNYRKPADSISSGPSANRQWQSQKPKRILAPALTEPLIRLYEVQRLVGLGKTKIYEMIVAGRFPAPYKVSSAARWSQHEVLNWIENIKGS